MVSFTHPNVWIRQGSPFRSLMYRYILTLFSSRGCCFHCFGGKGASVKRCLVYCVPLSSDVWCIVYPSLRHFLKSDIATIDEQSLLATMKPPVSDVSRMSLLLAYDLRVDTSTNIRCRCAMGHARREEQFLARRPAQ